MVISEITSGPVVLFCLTVCSKYTGVIEKEFCCKFPLAESYAITVVFLLELNGLWLLVYANVQTHLPRSTRTLNTIKAVGRCIC